MVIDLGPNDFALAAGVWDPRKGEGVGQDFVTVLRQHAWGYTTGQVTLTDRQWFPTRPGWRGKPAEIVSCCFEPSQALRITSGAGPD